MYQSFISLVEARYLADPVLRAFFLKIKIIFNESAMNKGIDSTCVRIKTQIPKMLFVVPYKDTWSGSICKFMGIVGTQEWKYSTSIYFEKIVIGLSLI